MNDALLDRIAKLPPKSIIALMLWKDRHRNPGLAISITEQDMTGLDACLAYLKIEAEVQIIRPRGRPPQAAATSRERGLIPATPGEPSRPFVSVALIEKGSAETEGVLGNAIVPCENNEEDAKRADQARRLDLIRPQIPAIMNRMRDERASGMLSEQTIEDACEALQALAAV